MRIDALIFDLDGTLADSLADIGTAMNEALVHHGFRPHELAAYNHFVGEGAEHLVRTALKAGGGDDAHFPAVLATFRERYGAQGHARSLPYPGIEDMLAQLVKRGVKLAVLSNKRDEFTKQLVAQRFGAIPFVDVRGERDGVPRKPDPTAALELALALNVLPAHIGFMGDTKYDVLTARAAGMQPIGVLWGFRDEAELTAAGAKVLLKHPGELIPLLR